MVYVAHLTTLEMMSADAIAEMESDFDQLAQDLKTQAGEQLGGREERWRFERRQGGGIPQQLIAAAEQILDEHPGETAAIVLGSSSQAAHRMVGSVAVSLARHAPVPLMIVP